MRKILVLISSLILATNILGSGSQRHQTLETKSKASVGKPQVGKPQKITPKVDLLPDSPGVDIPSLTSGRQEGSIGDWEYSINKDEKAIALHFGNYELLKGEVGIIFDFRIYKNLETGKSYIAYFLTDKKAQLTSIIGEEISDKEAALRGAGLSLKHIPSPLIETLVWNFFYG